MNLWRTPKRHYNNNIEQGKRNPFDKYNFAQKHRYLMYDLLANVDQGLVCEFPQKILKIIAQMSEGSFRMNLEDPYQRLCYETERKKKGRKSVDYELLFYGSSFRETIHKDTIHHPAEIVRSYKISARKRSIFFKAMMSSRTASAI